ncbi:MAG: threonine/serine exporter family protein [Pelosinus sp.]|nr:threonine/serine exporter family protein [Pelosinus sp.]
MLAFKIIAVFFMSASFGVLLRMPKGLLFYGGLVGVAAWLMMYGVLSISQSMVLAVFVGSIVIGLAAEFLARFLKKPATLFMIPGFIPFVPGGETYNTVRLLVEGRYIEGAAMGVRAALIGSAIAFGVFVSSTVLRLVMDQQNNKE